MITARLRASLIHRLSLTIWGLFLVLLLLLALLAYAALWLGADRVVPSVLQKVVQLKAQANEGLLLQAEASGEPLAVTAIVVAPFLRAMPAASMRSRVRPELEMMTAQSPGRIRYSPSSIDSNDRLRGISWMTIP